MLSCQCTYYWTREWIETPYFYINNDRIILRFSNLDEAEDDNLYYRMCKILLFDEVDFSKNTLHQVMYLGKKVRYQSFAYGKKETDS